MDVMVKKGVAFLPISLLPADIQENYKVFEWNHAIAILAGDFLQEFDEIIQVLRDFRLTRTDILTQGGRKSPIARKLDQPFYDMGWREKQFQIRNTIDENEVYIPTHKIDCYKNRIGVEVEWNNKDPFYDRDLNNFRLLFDLSAVSVGVIITRCDELQYIFDRLDKGDSYGASTTHWSKLIPRIEGRGSGGCPVLAFGISDRLYIDE